MQPKKTPFYGRNEHYFARMDYVMQHWQNEGVKQNTL